MSFILDALRKSESERQQDAKPSITRIPDAVQPSRLPPWALGTITVLGIGVLVLAVAWWRAQPVPATLSGPPAETPAATTPLRIPPRAASRPAPSPLASAAAVSGAPSALRSAAGSETASQAAIEEVSRSAAADLPRVEAALRDYASLAEQLGLPALRLELHSYGDDASKRFVFINGTRYREGETLSEGPRLIAINSRGAVLLAQDRQLLLSQQ